MKKNMILRALLVTAFLGLTAVQGFAVAITPNVGCVGSGTVVCNVDENMTYLLNAAPFNGTTYPVDGAIPLVIDLQTVGLTITTGDIFRITAEGDLCFHNGVSCQSPAFGAVFYSSNLLDPNNLVLNRVINALSAPSGTTAAPDAGNTTNGNFATNITQDFLIFQGSGTTFTMPSTSTYRYLFIGILDRYYGDNSDGRNVTNDLQVRLSVVPEPGTYGLLLSGLGALIAFRRYRKN